MPLSSNQLNATANVPGIFVYNPAAGAVLNAGANTLSVIFNPTDPVDYSSATDTVSLLVSSSTLTVMPANVNFAFGRTNSAPAGTTIGSTNSDNIMPMYASSPTTSSPVGPYPVVPTLSDLNNRLGAYALAINEDNGTLPILPVTTMGLAGISPALGPTHGGTAVTILGTNFLGGTTVSFGLLPAMSVTVNKGGNITAISPAQGAGWVNVVVTNGDGQVAVLTNGFTYGIPSYIITQPAPQTGVLAGNVTLSLDAGGSAPLNYQWLSNSINLPNATNSVLALTNLQAANAGFYVGIVSNLYGVVTSSPSSVSVLNVPVSFAETSAAIVNGQFHITLTNLTAQGTVVIKASTNLVQWTPIYTNPPTFGQIHFTDAITNAVGRCYKAVIVPPTPGQIYDFQTWPAASSPRFTIYR
jgi:hypothetical protein